MGGLSEGMMDGEPSATLGPGPLRPLPKVALNQRTRPKRRFSPSRTAVTKVAQILASPYFPGRPVARGLVGRELRTRSNVIDACGACIAW